MPDDALAELRRMVLDDRELMGWLLEASDRATFVARVVGVAGEFGLVVSASNVEEALSAARARHREDWV